MYFTRYVSGLLVLCIGISQAARSTNLDVQGSSRDFGFDRGFDTEASADGAYVWHDDEDDYSGWYEEDISSGDGAGVGGGVRLTECQRQNIKLREKQRKGLHYDYVPECTDRGVYQAMQCNPFGDCWCVTYSGDEIPDTRRSAPRRPSCNGLDRNTVYTTDILVDPEEGIIEVDNPGLETKNDNTGEDGNPDKQDSGETVFKEPPAQRAGFLAQPLILAGIIAFAVVCLLCAVLLVMFIVYRMRKKDEGSYALDEPKRSPSHPYQRAPTKEYFA